MIGQLILLGVVGLVVSKQLAAFKRWAWGLDDFRKSGFAQKDFMAVRKLKRPQVFVIVSQTVRPDSKALLQHLCPSQIRKTIFLCNVDASSQPSGQLPHKWKSPVEFYVSANPQTDILKYTEPSDYLVFASDTDKIFNGVIELYDYTMDYFEAKEPHVERLYTVHATKEWGLYVWSIRQSICVSRKQLDAVLQKQKSTEMPQTMLSWDASWTFLWNQYVWTSLQAMSVLVTETSEVYDPPQEPIAKSCAHMPLSQKESDVIWTFVEQCHT